jgi:thiamine-monophosphate kinase
MHPFAKIPRDSVSALGEENLIAAIRGWLGSASPSAPFGIGDDCAVLPASKQRQLITVDPVIFGRHFDADAAPRAVGEKLLKRNLSDIAAMGGLPTAAVISLILDPRVSRRWLEAFYRGLAACARRYEVSIVGGDIAQANGVLAASLTLLGQTNTHRAVTRTGAKIGDSIYVTGRLGGSLASGHHQSFIPRLREGAWLAQQRAVRSMMDVSDGLAKDLHALTPHGATPAIDPKAVPCRRGSDLRAALSDGEDYELVFSLAAMADRGAFAAAWRRKFPRTPLSLIGRFVRADALPADAINLGNYQGYEHLGGNRTIKNA